MKSKVENGEVIEAFRKDFTHTHGLPDGYENWANYYTALEAFITNALNQQRERG